MGFSTDLFVDTVDPNLICPVCLEVFSCAQSLTCGHTFCQGCLQDGKVKQCPTCRSKGGTSSPNFVLHGLIGNLTITCRNNNPDEPPAQRRRLKEGATGKCSWAGQLSEWQNHAKTDCCRPVGVCCVKGCGFVGTLKDLEHHNLQSLSKHQELLLKEHMDRLHGKIPKLVQNQVKADALYLLLSTFIRQWILHKPDPLYHFVVYQEQQPNTNRLLIGVPGPKRTIWEGGLYPVMFIWDDANCRRDFLT